MDLGLIERNLRANLYQTPTQFHADLNKIFTNSYRYNAKGSDIYKLTVELERHYNKMLGEVSIQQSKSNSHADANELHNRLALANRRVGEFLAAHVPKKRKKHQQQERVLTEVQISSLSAKIKQLPNHCLAEVMKIVAESRSSSTAPIRNIQEVDLNELEMGVLVELDRYVRLKVSPHVRRRKPKEPKLTPERSTGSGKPAEMPKPPANSSSL